MKAREELAVPKAEFRSYYGRPVLKPPVWEWKIPAYLFTGGLAAGSALLAAGADLTGRPALRRAGRLGSFGALLASLGLLVADLGRPERFHPHAAGGQADLADEHRHLDPHRVRARQRGRGRRRAAPAALVAAGPVPASLALAARPAGLSAAAVAPGVASYTAALLSQTAVPAWNEARHELPFVFTGSAAASGAGLGLLAAPVSEAAPARRLAVVGAAGELAARS